jgi:hypothetical protein
VGKEGLKFFKLVKKVPLFLCNSRFVTCSHIHTKHMLKQPKPLLRIKYFIYRNLKAGRQFSHTACRQASTTNVLNTGTRSDTSLTHITSWDGVIFILTDTATILHVLIFYDKRVLSVGVSARNLIWIPLGMFSWIRLISATVHDVIQKLNIKLIYVL